MRRFQTLRISIGLVAALQVACVSRPSLKQTIEMPLPPSKEAAPADRLDYLRRADIQLETKSGVIVREYDLSSFSIFGRVRDATAVDVVRLRVAGQSIEDTAALLPYVSEDSATARQHRMSEEVFDDAEFHTWLGLGFVLGGLGLGGAGVAIAAPNLDKDNGLYSVGVNVAVLSLVVGMLGGAIAFLTGPAPTQGYRSRMNARSHFLGDFEAQLGLCRTGENHTQIVACEQLNP